VSYSVEQFEGCTIVIGPVPVMQMVAIMSGGSDDTLIDPGLARIYGASLVAGTPENLDKLRNSSRTKTLAHEKALNERGEAQLSRDAISWLENGERGMSSEAMFTRFTGVSLDGECNHPHDADDFRRCRLLLEAVPEFQGKIHLMKDVSVQWHSLAGYWQELCDLMDEEAPDWRERHGISTKFDRKMAEFLA
jgi:hypothetical protein